MTLAAGNSSPELTVVLDIRYPQSYLALHPAIATAKARRIHIDWRPLSVATLKAPAPAMSKNPEERESRGIRHRRFRAEQIAREIEVYAAAQGLVMKEIYRSGDAAAFNRGWLWMRSHHGPRIEDYLCEGFRAYWALALDPALDSEVAHLIDSFDCDGSAFRAWSQADGNAALKREGDELNEFGVFAVPSYVVDAEVFLGRQHMPMIEWILDGRNGEGPI